MKSAFALAVLFAAATPALAQQQPFCPYGQTCQNSNPVPFPVINPVQGLNNLLTLPLKSGQPASPPPATGYAPIATPPPVMPPGTTR